MSAQRIIPLPFCFPPDQQEVYDNLNVEQRETFRALDEDERVTFFELESEKERADYLAKKAKEMANQAADRDAKEELKPEEIALKSAEVLRTAWSSLLGLFAKITYLAVIPIYLFYFLSSNRNLIDDLEGELGFLSASVKEDVVFLIREFVGILVAFFRGQLLIGLLMGVGYAIGFTLSGLKFGIALGLLFGLLNIVPYLGSIVGIVTRPARCLPATRRNFGDRAMDGFARLRNFLRGRPVDRELLPDPKDHGQANRFASRRGHRIDLFLGLRPRGAFSG